MSFWKLFFSFRIVIQKMVLLVLFEVIKRISHYLKEPQDNFISCYAGF